jgi:hypothetical protein
MKKVCLSIILYVLCAQVFAFEHIGFSVVDSLEKYESGYEFFSVDFSNPADIVSFGMLIGREEWVTGGKENWWRIIVMTSARPVAVYENNTNLRQVIKDKMRQLGANVSITIAGDAHMYVNILMPNGRYTTIVYY